MEAILDGAALQALVEDPKLQQRLPFFKRFAVKPSGKSCCGREREKLSSLRVAELKAAFAVLPEQDIRAIKEHLRCTTLRIITRTKTGFASTLR